MQIQKEKSATSLTIHLSVQEHTVFMLLLYRVIVEITSPVFVSSSSNSSAAVTDPFLIALKV